ncbi:MAG TPA: phosphotransferase [Thermomicrobiales bacterium]|nr:phosphotransferase [Thermomicrobiales bacterium]
MDTALRDYPELAGESVTVTSGQFNDILIVGEIVFRFPRTEDAAASMSTEVTVLQQLQGRLPIAIPNPVFSRKSRDMSLPPFMGYRRIAGRPLDRRTLDELWATDRLVVELLGAQLGAFLRVLHAIPADAFDETVPLADDGTHWTRLLEAFRDELFRYMRQDAREAVERDFLAFLSSPDSFGWQPVLMHGDFGGANVLYDDALRRISGVIDFGGVALGDAAVDLAAITAFHSRLAQTMQPHYPELFVPEMQRRASFYRSTFALQQALWALRAGDAEAFDDGIAAYV